MRDRYSPSAIASSAPGAGAAESPRGTRSIMTVLFSEKGIVRISPFAFTPKAPRIRDSRLSSCQSSVEKMVSLAWRMSVSIGASTAAGFEIVEDPVTTSSTEICTRTDCGSVLDTP